MTANSSSSVETNPCHHVFISPPRLGHSCSDLRAFDNPAYEDVVLRGQGYVPPDTAKKTSSLERGARAVAEAFRERVSSLKRGRGQEECASALLEDEGDCDDVMVQSWGSQCRGGGSEDYEDVVYSRPAEDKPSTHHPPLPSKPHPPIPPKPRPPLPSKPHPHIPPKSRPPLPPKPRCVCVHVRESQ